MVGIDTDNVIQYYILKEKKLALERAYVCESCRLRMLFLFDSKNKGDERICRAELMVLLLKIQQVNEEIAAFRLRENWKEEPFDTILRENDHQPIF